MTLAIVPKPRVGRTRRARPVLAAAAVGGLLLALLAVSPEAAYADDYPSWQDVQNAQGNEQATQDEITRINDALTSAQQKAADAPPRRSRPSRRPVPRAPQRTRPPDAPRS